MSAQTLVLRIAGGWGNASRWDYSRGVFNDFPSNGVRISDGTQAA